MTRNWIVLSGLVTVMVPVSLIADCYTRCKPSLFFPERIDCHTTCDGSSSGGSYALSNSTGPFYGGIRILGALPQGQAGVLTTKSASYYGLNGSQLSSKSESLSGMGLAIEFTPTKNGIGPVYGVGGWSQPVQISGKSAGNLAVAFVDVGLEAGGYVPALRSRFFARGTYALLQSSYYEAKAPEGYSDGQETYWAPALGAGMEFRTKGNYFLSLGLRYLLAETSYAGARGLVLNHNAPVFVLGFSYIP